MLRRGGPPIISFTLAISLAACAIFVIEQLDLQVLVIEGSLFLESDPALQSKEERAAATEALTVSCVLFGI